MTDATRTPGDDPEIAPLRRPGRRRVIALLVTGLAFVAAAGVASGIVLERRVLARHWEHGHGGPRGYSGRHGPMHARFGRDLGLTPRQELAIDSIFARHRPAIDSARVASGPAIRAIIDQTRRQIDSVLTPEQRAKMHARMLREHPPGDSMPHDGMRPSRF